MPVYTNPRFEPAEHGFHFNNTFENTELIKEVAADLGLPFSIPDFSFGNPIRTGGRCGGMTYAVLDYFLSSQFDIPKVSETPPDGDVLADYILERQYDSFFSVADEYLDNLINPWAGNKYYQDCLPPNGHNYLYYKKKIDSNECRPLALLPVGSLIGHQVLGIGYTDHRDPERVLIHIYDPNSRNTERVLKLNITKGVWECWKLDLSAKYTKTEYRAWVPADGYSYKKPDIHDLYTGIRNYSGKDLRNWKPPGKEDLTRYRFVGCNFSHNLHLESCDFEGVNAEGAVFSNANVSKSEFRKAILTKCNFSNANLRGSTLDGATINSASFSNTNLGDASFRQVEGTEYPVYFNQAKLNTTDFRKARMQAHFNQAAIVNSKFGEASLRESRFVNSAINTSNFQGADLGLTNWSNAVLESCNFSSVSDSILTQLSNANFAGSVMKNCQFKGTQCYGAKFLNTALNEIDFAESFLRKVDFSGSALSNIKFANANISYTKFDGAVLNGVDFSNALFTYSSWKGASIKNSKGLTPKMYDWLRRQGAIF